MDAYVSWHSVQTMLASTHIQLVSVELKWHPRGHHGNTKRNLSLLWPIQYCNSVIFMGIMHHLDGLGVNICCTKTISMDYIEIYMIYGYGKTCA